MEIEYEPGTIPATTRGIIVPSKSSPTTLFTTTPTLGKKVIRLDNGETNDYYEVDVDSNGKPIFNSNCTHCLAFPFMTRKNDQFSINVQIEWARRP